MPLTASRKPLIPLGLVNKRSFEPLLRFSALSGHSSNLRVFQNNPCEPVNPKPPGFLHLIRTPSCVHGEPHNQDTFRTFNAQRATVPFEIHAPEDPEDPQHQAGKRSRPRAPGLTAAPTISIVEFSSPDPLSETAFAQTTLRAVFMPMRR